MNDSTVPVRPRTRRELTWGVFDQGFSSGTNLALSVLAAPIPGGIQLGARVTLEQLEAEHLRRILQSTPTIEEASNVLQLGS